MHFWGPKSKRFFRLRLGCLIPPLLFQTYVASISFGHLWFQDTQNIFFFPDWKSGFSSCSDYPVDGTLNLCHETLMKRNWLDPITQYRKKVQNVPKYRLFSTIVKSNKNTDILARFGCFLVTEWLDQADSFSWAISVSWHKFRVPSTG